MAGTPIVSCYTYCRYVLPPTAHAINGRRRYPRMAKNLVDKKNGFKMDIRLHTNNTTPLLQLFNHCNYFNFTKPFVAIFLGILYLGVP